ncbi:MAG TPA: 1,2-phenylacetyl-CoA epoxidase subunit PaaC [Streptosporangiaceae bacterium]|nr:1,2-phenylacetyl-CoA epoxidase subunit PaaC [Streptosporangiaceae bacterium]
MGFDTAYRAIAEDEGDQRWAFGTGFIGPLAGVDQAVPDGADGAELGAYCLMLGDDALIMSHRMQQWLARAPELEEETALANIALDLLGQARLLLTRAGQADGTGRDEDDFAFGRDVHEFRNVWLAEVTDADFGGLIARLLVFSTWRLALLDRLRASRDPVLAAVAAKGVKELTYHRDYAAQWVLRLAGGTEFSRERIVAGLGVVTPLTHELFTPTDTELGLSAAGLSPSPASLREEVTQVLAHVLYPAGLTPPLAPAGEPSARERAAREPAPGPTPGGRHGVHTEAMAELVVELQSVARACPGATW